MIPHGEYVVRIASIQRTYDVNKGRERIRVTYQILEGEYQNCGIRDNYFLSENLSRDTQIFQYGNIKKFFLAINPNIPFNFGTMDEVEENIKLYMTSIRNVKFHIVFRADNKGYDKVYIQSREAYVPEEDKDAEEYQAYEEDMRKRGYY